MRSLAEIIIIMPTVASRISTPNSRRAIPWRVTYSWEMVMASADAMRTSTLKNTANASLMNMPPKVSTGPLAMVVTRSRVRTRVVKLRFEINCAVFTPSFPSLPV